MSDTSQREMIYDLLDGSTSFDSLCEDFDDEANCYETLRDHAKRNLDSFDELIEFHQVCINQGPTAFVYDQLQRNANRSLKNMMLRSSRSGRQFPIDDVSELEYRISKYTELGINNLDSQAVGATVLEFLYDDHTDHIEPILTSLMQTRPDEQSQATELFARALTVERLDQGSNTTEAFEEYVIEFSDLLPDPLPSVNQTADKLWNEAESRSFADPDKVRYAQASLAAETTRSRVAEYLYLTVSDTVGRYRHGDRREPHRGELLLARQQSRLLLNQFSRQFSDNEVSRVRSYVDQLSGQLKAGNWWRSQRDPFDRPEPNYHSAASDFYQAAEHVRNVDKNRYLKYVSKAARHQANAVSNRGYGTQSGWDICAQLHSCAREILPQIIPDPNNDELETINGLLAVHQYEEQVARAAGACVCGDLTEIREYTDEARDLLSTSPIKRNPQRLEELERVGDGLYLEQEGEYAEALERYEQANTPELNLKLRRDLTKIKQEVSSSNYRSASDIATETFGEESSITAAIKIAGGEQPQSPSVNEDIQRELLGATAQQLQTFVIFTHLVAQGDSIESHIGSKIEEMLFEL